MPSTSNPYTPEFAAAVVALAVADSLVRSAQESMHRAQTALASLCPVKPGDTYEYTERLYSGATRRYRMRVHGIRAQKDRWFLRGTAVLPNGDLGTKVLTTSIPHPQRESL